MTQESVRNNSDKAALCRSASEAMENKEKELFSVFIGLENASPIGTSIDRIKAVHEWGVRYITLCHTGNNEIIFGVATCQIGHCRHHFTQFHLSASRHKSYYRTVVKIVLLAKIVLFIN